MLWQTGRQPAVPLAAIMSASSVGVFIHKLHHERVRRRIIALAGGTGFKRDFIPLRVAPVPCIWGPGRKRLTSGSVSTRAVTDLFDALSPPIRSAQLRACPLDRGAAQPVPVLRLRDHPRSPNARHRGHPQGRLENSPGPGPPATCENQSKSGSGPLIQNRETNSWNDGAISAGPSLYEYQFTN